MLDDEKPPEMLRRLIAVRGLPALTGISTVTRPPAPRAEMDHASQPGPRRMAEGAGISGLNPKALLLFLARLPPAGAADPARRRGPDPVLGSRDDRHRRPAAHRARAALTGYRAPIAWRDG